MKEKHFQELKESGISQEIIDLNFKSLEGDNVYEYLAVGCQKRLNSGMLPKAWINLYEHCAKGGWWCNGIDLVNGTENYWGCFKADFPRLDEFGLKPIKYEHPKGYPTDLFALRIGRNHLKGIKFFTEIDIEDPDLFWDAVIADPEIPITITEGAKKAACLLSHNEVAIGLPGIWGAYRRELKETNQLIPAMAKLATEGRTFVFAFDQDAKTETRKQVKAAFKKTKECLEKFGCKAVMATWEEQYKGVDDLIVAKGVKAWADARTKALETKVIEVKPSGQEAKTTKPLKEPIPETARVYGGTKDLKTAELVEFVENNLANRLSFDELRSDLLLDGDRLNLGSDCKIWFLRKFGETASKEDIYDTIVNFAKENTFNPVEKYLKTVASKPERVRIDNIAEKYFGRSEPIYNRLVEMWLISAVARAINKGIDDNPGVQVDHTLILQSGQGKYKSTWFKVLGGKWFSDSVKDIESKDSLMIVHSNWIIELSELDRITSKKQAGAIKHWLTQKTDSYRKPYAREIEPNLPRPCVFCGTVNPSRFLVDDENRRFWIIPVSESVAEIDIPLITKERDGIWASAYEAYLRGQQWWPTEEEKSLIKLINDEFKEVDAWQDVIEDWIRDREFICSYEILTELFKIEPGNIKRAEDMRTMKILNSLGWTKETRKELTDSMGNKKYRRVRLNPYLNNLNGKVGKDGKRIDLKESESYQPTTNQEDRLVVEKLTNLPTPNYQPTNPETQTEQAIDQRSNLIHQLSNSTPKKQESKWIEVKDPTKLKTGQTVACGENKVFTLAKKLGSGWMTQCGSEILNWEIVWLWEEKETQYR